MRHKIRKINNKEETFKTKRGFTLIELLAIVVIISVVLLIGFGVYNGVINNMKANSTALAISSVKSAAELYSRETSDKIKWMSFYDGDTGKESGRFVCMTVKQLVNAGFFDENFFDKEIYKNSEIGNNTFLEIKQNINYSETKVIMHEKDTSKLMCEVSAINEKLDDLNIDNVKSFTDRVSFDIFLKDNSVNVGDVSYSCYIGDKAGIIEGNKCTFTGLKNATKYKKVKVCMSPNIGNTYLTSTTCGMFDVETVDFGKPTITVWDADSWRKEKKVEVEYSNENIYDNTASYYFKSEVSATTESNVYLCSSGTSNCTTSATNIVAGKWYKAEGTSVTFVANENTGKVIKKITARIQDETGNYSDNVGSITKIDTIAPTCTNSGGSTTWINKSSSQTKVTIVGTCKDEDGGSGCVNTTIKKDFATDINTTAASPGTVSDYAGNKTDCSPNQTVKIDKTPPTCTTSGGGSWTKNNVTLTGTCNDSGSKCVSTTVTNTFNTEQNGNQSPGSVTDNAGNTTICPNGKVMIDKTPPTCSVTGGEGWSNSSITLTGRCSNDNGTYQSGCSSATVTGTYTEVQNTTKNIGNISDIAGNTASCSGAVRIETTYPSLTVTMYKRKKKDDGSYTKTGDALCTQTVNSTTKTASLSGCTGKTNGWYNKENFPYGVYFSISASDGGGSGISQKIWYYNDSGFPKDNGDNDYPKDTDNSKKSGYSRTQNNTVKGLNDNVVSLSGDGHRLARYLVKDVAGNTVYININVPIDKTGPTITCETRGWNDSCCNNRDGLRYVLRCWLRDNVSGLRSRKYGYCSRSCNPDSEYDAASFSTETQSRKQFIDTMWYDYDEMNWKYDEWYRTAASSNYKIRIKDQAGNNSSIVTWSGSYNKGTNNAISTITGEGRCADWCEK